MFCHEAKPIMYQEQASGEGFLFCAAGLGASTEIHVVWDILLHLSEILW